MSDSRTSPSFFTPDKCCNMQVVITVRALVEWWHIIVSTIPCSVYYRETTDVCTGPAWEVSCGRVSFKQIPFKFAIRYSNRNMHCSRLFWSVNKTWLLRRERLSCFPHHHRSWDRGLFSNLKWCLILKRLSTKIDAAADQGTWFECSSRTIPNCFLAESSSLLRKPVAGSLGHIPIQQVGMHTVNSTVAVLARIWEGMGPDMRHFSSSKKHRSCF